MKIIWITRSDPRLLTNGSNLYTRGLLDGLRSIGADVTVFGYEWPAARNLPDGGLNLQLLKPPKVWRALSLFSSLQSDAFRQRSPEMARLIHDAMVPGLDAVVFDYFATGWALPIVTKAIEKIPASQRPEIIHVTHNFETGVRRTIAAGYKGSIFMKWILRIDAAKAAHLEKRLLCASDIVTSNTDSDREHFEAIVPDKTHLTLIPAYSGPRDFGPPMTTETPRRIVMMGSLDWIAKRENLRRFVQAAEGPFRANGLELVIVGRADGRFVESVKSQSTICRFLGFVDDPLPLLRSARLGLMPDELGGGFKHRYLAYIFQGLPVATIRSQAVGMPFEPEDGMVVGDDADELVGRIVEVIDDIPTLERLRRVAFDACQGHFDWMTRGRDLYNAIVATRLSKGKGRID